MAQIDGKHGIIDKVIGKLDYKASNKRLEIRMAIEVLQSSKSHS
jgi:hypothetical protein